jgi:hypothetical protein
MQSSLVFTVIAGVLVGLAFSHGQAFGEEGQNDVFGANSGDDHDASDLSLLQQSLQVNATVTKEDLPYCEDDMRSECACKGSGNVVCWNAGESDCQDTMDTKDDGTCPQWYDGKCLDTCVANACEWDLILDKSSCSIEWVSDSQTDDDPIRFDPSVSDDTCEDSVKDCYKACATACEKAGHEAFTWYQGGACSCGSSSCGTADFPSASDDYHTISGAVGCVANGA